MKVGDVVIAVPPFVLACGSGWYDSAVVVNVDPLVIVSRGGDMLWRSTITKENLNVIGRADPQTFNVSMERFQREAK